jgi:hypothetical protein
MGVGALALLVATATPAAAIQTRTWTLDPDDLQRGDLDGVAVTGRGTLSLAPALERIGGEAMASQAAHVWALAADPQGQPMLGTGPDGRILKLASGGAATVLHTLSEPLVTALALLPGGDLLAATAPRGRIFRIGPGGASRLWCDTQERYVWSLAVLPDGSVLAGTGDQGRLLRIDEEGRSSILFDSADAHLVTVVPDRRNTVLVGSGGRGLVYRVDLKGAASVLHDDDLPEVHAVLPQNDGGVLAAVLAAPPSDPRVPALRIRLPGGAEAGPSADTMGAFEGGGSTLEGVIEGLPGGDDEVARGVRGRLVRIAPDGVATELWRSSSEVPLAMASDARGGVLFGTGEPARLYRLDPDGEVALINTLREGQITALLRVGVQLFIATSNPAAVYRLGPQPTAAGSYVSRPIDAGGIARWGMLRWNASAPGGGVELATRTGNSAEPDSTWSPWSGPLRDGAGGAVTSPEGRFLQWRLRLSLSGDLIGVSGVTVSYSPRNRPPEFRDFRLDKASAPTVSKDATFRYVVVDPDADPLDVQLQYRPLSGGPWSSGVQAWVSDPAAASSAGPEEMRKDGRLVWDTTSVTEGTYEVRALASDKPSNHPGEGREAATQAALVIQVDRTPPEVQVRSGSDGEVEVTVTDDLSPTGRLEVVESGQVLFLAVPDDGVSDSRRETYRIATRASAAGPGSRVIRAVDAAGNAVERPLQGP